MIEDKNTTSLELMELFERKSYDELNSYYEEIIQKLYFQWHNQRDGFQKSLRFLSLDMAEVYSYIHTAQADVKSLFNLGALSGALESFTQVLREKNQEQIAQTIIKESLISVKHLGDIVSVLGMHGIMSHQELSVALGLRASTLTEAMKKVLETDAVQTGTSGRYRMYSLTELGVQMDKYIRNKKSGRKTTDEMSEMIREHLLCIIDTQEKYNAQKKLLESIGLDSDCTIHVDDNVSVHTKGHGEQRGTYHVETITVINLDSDTPKKGMILSEIKSLKNEPADRSDTQTDSFNYRSYSYDTITNVG